MKITMSNHMDFESAVRSTLNFLKRTQAIKSFSIHKIDNGQIKVTMTSVTGEDTSLQLRSSYGKVAAEKIIKGRAAEFSSGKVQRHQQLEVA